MKYILIVQPTIANSYLQSIILNLTVTDIIFSKKNQHYRFIPVLQKPPSNF